MRDHWSGQRERGNTFSLAVILWVALHLGRGAARLLLYPITGYFLLSARVQRRASRDYLQRVYGKPGGLVQSARHIHCFAATILDRVFFLAGRHRDFDVRLHRSELVLDTVSRGRGAILLGSHLGSFEALRALGVDRARIPLKVLMYPDHNQAITRVFERLNPEIARTLIPLGAPGTLLAVHEALQRGELVGILGDRAAPGEKTVSCRFLGAPALFPLGPALLALTTQVPIILFFALYRGGKRYDIYFERLDYAPAPDRRRRTDLAAELTQRFAGRLEHHLRLAPYNWFNFYAFWEHGETDQ